MSSRGVNAGSPLLRLLEATSILVAMPAAAQNTQAPTVITVPQPTFDLRPGTPTPTPTPSPAATAAPPAAVPTAPIATPRATPTPRAGPPPVSRATPSAPSPTPLPEPVEALPQATPTLPPAAAAVLAPTPTPTPTPVAAAAPAPGNGYPLWWWLLGGLLLAGLGYLGWRRWTAVAEPEADRRAAPVPRPAAPPTPRLPVPAVVQADAPALALDFRPTGFRTQGPDAFVRFALTIANTSDQPVEAIRMLVALTTAAPDLVDRIAAFNANAPMSAASAPFNLAAGASERIDGEVLLPGDAMFVTEKDDRALIVPVALVNLRWRAGLSLRSRGESWMIGTGETGAGKLGPVRVDRPLRAGTRLAARRFDVPPK